MAEANSNIPNFSPTKQFSSPQTHLYRTNLLELVTDFADLEDPDQLESILSLVSGFPSTSSRNSTLQTFHLPIPPAQPHQPPAASPRGNQRGSKINLVEPLDSKKHHKQPPLPVGPLYLELLRLQATSDSNFQPHHPESKLRKQSVAKTPNIPHAATPPTATSPPFPSSNCHNYLFDRNSTPDVLQTPLFEDFFSFHHQSSSNDFTREMTSRRDSTLPQPTRTTSQHAITPTPNRNQPSLPSIQQQPRDPPQELLPANLFLSKFTPKQHKTFERFSQHTLLTPSSDFKVHSMHAIAAQQPDQPQSHQNSKKHHNLSPVEAFVQRETELAAFFDQFGKYLDDSGHFIELPPLQSHVDKSIMNISGTYVMSNLLQIKNRPDEAFCRRFQPQTVVDDHDHDHDDDHGDQCGEDHHIFPGDHHQDGDNNSNQTHHSHCSDKHNHATTGNSPLTTPSKDQLVKTRKNSIYDTPTYYQRYSLHSHNPSVSSNHTTTSGGATSGSNAAESQDDDEKRAAAKQKQLQSMHDDTERQRKLQKNVEKLLSTAKEHYKDDDVDFRDKQHHRFSPYELTPPEQKSQIDQQAAFRFYTIIFIIALCLLFVLFGLWVFMTSFAIMCYVSIGQSNADPTQGTATDFACFQNSTATVIVLTIIGLVPFLCVFLVFFTNCVNLALFKLGFRQPLDDLHL